MPQSSRCERSERAQPSARRLGGPREQCTPQALRDSYATLWSLTCCKNYARAAHSAVGAVINS
jgi:hypothetical protein